MLTTFFTVNCGTGNAPNSTPGDLAGLGTPGGATTGATPSNTFISALYTGLPAGTVYYSHNHLGSGALVTDSAGNEVFRITYTEYGEIDLHNSGKYNPATKKIAHNLEDALIAITAVKYTGQEYDPETGFYYYNARYYDPQLGVFTTPDTLVPDAKASQAYNRYMYVKGNPIMYSDPSGHSFWSVFAAIAVVVVSVAATVATAGAMAPEAAAATAAESATIAGAEAAGSAAIGSSVEFGTAAGIGVAGAATNAGIGTTLGIGAISGAAGGFVGGAGMAMVNGETNFGKIMTEGLYCAIGGAVGGGLSAGFGYIAKAGEMAGFFGESGFNTLKYSGNFVGSFSATMTAGSLSCNNEGGSSSCYNDMFKSALLGASVSVAAEYGGEKYRQLWGKMGYFSEDESNSSFSRDRTSILNGTKEPNLSMRILRNIPGADSVMRFANSSGLRSLNTFGRYYGASFLSGIDLSLTATEFAPWDQWRPFKTPEENSGNQ